MKNEIIDLDLQVFAARTLREFSKELRSYYGIIAFDPKRLDMLEVHKRVNNLVNSFAEFYIKHPDVQQNYTLNNFIKRIALNLYFIENPNIDTMLEVCSNIGMFLALCRIEEE